MRGRLRGRQSHHNDEESRGSIQTAETIKKSQPQPKRVAFFDVLTFAVVACVIFFNNLQQRSIIFDVVLSAALLVKVLIGLFFYKHNNARSLRIYFLWRYLYNIFVIYPLIIILRYFTATYVLNYFLAGGITLLFEIIVTACYIKHLCTKQPIENIEDIPGFSIKSKRGNDLTVLHIKSIKSGDYLIKSIGKKQAERIVKNKLKEQDEINMKKNNQTKIKSGKQMTKIQQLEYRKELQSKVHMGFNLIRSEEEIEAEIEYEEILKAKLEGQTTFMTFQDRMSRNVVNDIVLQENMPLEKEQIQQREDAREDQERERAKMMRAFQQKKNSNTIAGADDPQNNKQNNSTSDQEDSTNSKNMKISSKENKFHQDSQEKSNLKTTVRDGYDDKDGPSPYQQQDNNLQEEDIIVEQDDIKIKFKSNNDNNNDKKNVQNRQQQQIKNSDDTIKADHEEDLEIQTDRGLNYKPNTSKTNDTNLQKPVSQKQKTNNNSQNKDKQIDNNNNNDNHSKSQDQSNIRQSKHSEPKNTQQQEQPQNSQSNNTRSSNKQQQNTQSSQNQDQKQEEKKKSQMTYQEKFEMQRLQIQKQQQNQVQNRQQQFSGKHAYAQNKIQKELQKKAELKKQMEEQKRREEEGGSSSDSDSDNSYYSDESPRTRKQRKLAKQQKKQLQKQKTKKIHGKNDNGGDSSSSLSEGGDDGDVKKNRKRQQNPQSQQQQQRNNQQQKKQVKFDENKNTVKQVDNYDHGTNNNNNAYNDYDDEDYDSEEESN